MNIYDKFFALAKEKGVDEVEINVSKSSNLSIQLYHHEIETFIANTDGSVSIRGVYNNKFGTISLSSLTKDNLNYAVDMLINNAKVIEKSEKAELFGGSEHYHKVSTYNKGYEKITIEQKKADLFKLESLIEKGDSRVADVMNVGFEETISENMILKSLDIIVLF